MPDDRKAPITPETSGSKDCWRKAESPTTPLQTHVLPSDKDPHVLTEAVINGLCSGMAIPKKVDKWWGHELHYRNDKFYCMKWLHLKYGGATSLHYHVGKHETLLIVSGTFTVETRYNKTTKYKRL